MKLLHHDQVELSRYLMSSLPDGAEVVDCTIAPPADMLVSAYPSVVITVPARADQRMQFDADGNILGVASVEIPEHEEVLRCPVSWDAVNQVIDYFEILSNTGGL